MPDAASKPAGTLGERLLAGDRRALARAISLVENRDPEGDALVARALPAHRQGARIVGITGPPGVGKSTLIGAMTAELRKADREVGVLSIDPSSPFTRGAVLGDRIRLSDHFLDPGVFIRSMASRGALGGLAEAALQAALLMDAAGKDDVLLETVGVGQGEIDVVDHADTIVLALMPGSGDSIQALKAGVMEIPDVIVVNKADHPLADTMVREVRARAGARPAALVARPGGADRGVQGRGRRRAGGDGSTSTAPTSRRRARWTSAAPATSAPRCSASPRRGCGASSRTAPRRTRVDGLLDSVVRRETDPATAARKLLEGRWMTDEDDADATTGASPARGSLGADEVQGWTGVRLDDMTGSDDRQASRARDRGPGRPAAPSWLLARHGPVRARTA